MKKQFTYIFRHLAAVLLMAMPVMAQAQTFHYEVFTEPGASVSPRQVSNHMYDLHMDEEDSKCIGWSSEPISGIPDYQIIFGETPGAVGYTTNWEGEEIMVISSAPMYTLNSSIRVQGGCQTYVFIKRELCSTWTTYESPSGWTKPGGSFYWGGIQETHILRIFGGHSSVPTVPDKSSEKPGASAEVGGFYTSPSGITTALGDEDSTDEEEGSVTMTSTLTVEEALALIAAGMDSPTFVGSYKGMYFRLPAGKGYAEFDVESMGGYALSVLAGTDFIGSFTKTEKGTVRIPYDLSDETWIYAFPTSSTASAPASIRRIPAAGDGLKIYSVKVVGGGEDVNVTIAKEGFGTYYDSQKDVMLPAGMKALIVTADGGSGALTYKTIADGDTDDSIVPAGTAVLLQTEGASAAQTLTLPLYSAAKDAVTESNLLHGSDEATTTTGGDKYYKLSYKEGANLGWYWGATDGAAFQSGAHKAWLALPASVGVKEFFGLPGNDATGIQHITESSPAKEGWFNLSGMKMDKKPTEKGIYLNHGKRVVIK